MPETVFEEYVEFEKRHLGSLISAATELHSSVGGPVRFLDLATGPNEFNPGLIRALSEAGVDYQFVLSDISPVRFRKGYENLEGTLTPEELARVSCVLADANDLRREQRKVVVYGEQGQLRVPLKSVLQDPDNCFLHKGYHNGRRVETFADESFHVVMGIIPYGSMGRYDAAIRESARVLAPGGYHVVLEWDIEKMNKEAERTPGAMRGALQPHLQRVGQQLNALLEPVDALVTYRHYNVDYKDPDEVVQNGDLLKHTVLIHQKPRTPNA